MRKFLFLLVAVIATLNVRAADYDFEDENGLQYSITDLVNLTAKVVGYNCPDEESTEEESTEEGSTSTTVTIPATVEYSGRTLTVTSIEHTFVSCENITSVIISEGISSIGTNAFTGCPNLSSITIPSSVTSIGTMAIYKCTALTEVTLPDSITSIGDYAFSFSGLMTIAIPDAVTSIGEYAFYNCKALEEITFTSSSSLTSIGVYAFSLSGLVSIAIPEKIETINEYTFASCQSLTQVSMSNAVTTINNRAFYECSSLSDITLSNSLQTIGSYAFYECTSLETISLPESITSIGSYAFRNSGLKTLTLPDAFTSIPSYSFYGCTSLEEIVLPAQLKSISTYAFYNCPSLKNLDFPSTVTDLGNYAFEGCKGLKTLKIGKGLKYVKDYATSYTYYYPLLYIDGPSEMDSIIIKDGPTEFSIRGFAYLNSSYSAAYAYPLFSNIAVNYYYVGRTLSDISEWQYNNQKHVIKVSQPYGTITTLEIGGYCTDVPYFYQSVDTLILGEDVKTFTAKNIYEDGLKAIYCRSTTPATISGTFETSTYLNVKVYVPVGSLETYKADDGWISFWNIEELEEMPEGYVGSKIFQDETTGLYFLSDEDDKTVTLISSQGDAYSGAIVIPETVNGYTVIAIEDNAFAGSDIESVEIPETVTEIGDNAFASCSSLVSVTMHSDTAPTLGEDAFDGISSDAILYVPSKSAYSSWSDYFWLTGTEIFQDETTGLYFFSDEEEKTVTLIPSQGDAYSGDIVIPETITVIAESGDEIVYSVVRIDNNAFAGSDIESVEIPETVTEIGDNAFSSCSSLVSVTMDSDTAPTLGEDAFDGISSDAILYVPSKSAYSSWSDYFWLIGTEIFQDETTGLYFFSDEEEKTVTLIPTQGDAYSGDIVIPETVNGYTVIAIADNAFAGSTVESVEIPETVTEIGENAFASCSSLVSVTMHSDTAPTLGEDAFDGISSDAILYVPKGSRYAYSSWSDYFWLIGTEIFQDETSGLYFLSDEEDKTVTLIPSQGDAYSGDIVIPEAVYGYTVIAIADNAFAGSTIESVEIPETIKEIGDNAFASCSSLVRVAMHSATAPTLGEDAFDGISSDAILYIPEGTKSAYDSWSSYFSSIITAIEEITVPVDKVEIARYNLAGQRLLAPTKGINFISYSDGTTQKVLVK